MYLKGYKIIYEKEKVLILPKWDFGGNKSHTNRYWNKILSEIRTLKESSYPFKIYDIDNADNVFIKLNSIQEFENWLEKDFNKEKFD